MLGEVREQSESLAPIESAVGTGPIQSARRADCKGVVLYNHNNNNNYNNNLRNLIGKGIMIMVLVYRMFTGAYMKLSHPRH